MSAIERATLAQASVITVTNADTEYSLQLPVWTKSLKIQCRDGTDIRIAFEAGKVATPTDPYFTVKSGSVLSGDRLSFNLNTIYVACASGSKKVEVLAFY